MSVNVCVCVEGGGNSLGGGVRTVSGVAKVWTHRYHDGGAVLFLPPDVVNEELQVTCERTGREYMMRDLSIR